LTTNLSPSNDKNYYCQSKKWDRVPDLEEVKDRRWDKIGSLTLLFERLLGNIQRPTVIEPG